MGAAVMLAAPAGAQADDRALLERHRPVYVNDGRDRHPVAGVRGEAPASYGRAAPAAGGGRWLQYWRWHAYNAQDRGILRTGRHEGDWELVQVGRLALHPAVTEISDQHERGKLVNAAWRRYGTVNTLSLLAVATGWAGARAAEAGDHRLSKDERRLARAKDVLVGVVAVTGVATAVEGVRFSRSAPNGAVPLRDGDHAAVNASPESARRKRRVNALGTASMVAEVALVGVNSALGQQNFRRPPARRFLIRR